MRTTAHDRILDRRGKTITTFVIFDVVGELESMAEGEVLEVLTDDFEPFRADMAAWSSATGHRLLHEESTADGLRFHVEKGRGQQTDTRVAIVVSNDGLEELLTPLGFALAAALQGLDVHLFVQGPGVRALSRGFRPKLHGWARPFSRFAAAGLTKTGHIPAQQKFRQLRDLGAHIYMCGPSMLHFKVRKDDLIFDDLPLVEYFTFMTVMEQAQTTIYT